MLPILAKELRSRLRGRRGPSVLFIYLLVLGVVCVGVLQNSLNNNTLANGEAAKVGIALFQALATIQGILIVFVTPATTSAAISGERQRQTLDLLLVTRLSSLGITLGKLIAALSFCLLLIVCSLPIFSLAFLFGGVGPDRVAGSFLVFVATMLCFGSISLLVSVLTRRAEAATVISYTIVLLLTLGLALLTLYLDLVGATVGTGSSPLPLTAYFDPGFALFAVLPGVDGGSATGFSADVWQINCVINVAITAICILLSAALLRQQRA